jgi:hypothetical protein
MGTYVSSHTGKLVFQEGALVEAVRKGYWIILDELNLAPSEVLEALNRLLDDNRFGALAALPFKRRVCCELAAVCCGCSESSSSRKPKKLSSRTTASCCSQHRTRRACTVAGNHSRSHFAIASWSCM